jgi:hypothetical protein
MDGLKNDNCLNTGILKLRALYFQTAGSRLNRIVIVLMLLSRLKLEILKLVVCILLCVLCQLQGFRLTQHYFEYFI